MVAAADELGQGSLEAAERYLGIADRRSASMPEARRSELQLLLRMVSLMLAGQRGNLSGVGEEARRLAGIAEDGDAAQPDLRDDLLALALISLGGTEFWAIRSEGAERYLEQGVALARRTGRSFLEFLGLAYQGIHEFYHSFARATERGAQAVELAERHGWTNNPAFGVACVVLGAVLVWQGQLDKAEPWIQRAEGSVRAETDPAATISIRDIRGVLERARGHDTEALAILQTAERLAQQLAGPHHLLAPTRAEILRTLVRLNETERAEQALAALTEQDRESGHVRIATAALRLAQGDPDAATAALAPVLDSSDPIIVWTWMVDAYLLEATARDTLGDPDAAHSALERALDIAEPYGAVTPFLMRPTPGLLERHARHHTAHAFLVAQIQGLLAGQTPTTSAAGRQLPVEPLSDSELRVLRYLPTNLTAPEIARELYVSPNTVKTHVHNLYAKLHTHRRAEAVEAARALGLLAPSGVGRTKSVARD